MKEVTKIDVVSLGKFMAITSAILGALVSVLLGLGALLIDPVAGIITLVISLVTFVIGGAIGGFINGAICALLYNYIFSKIVKFEVE